ncbi:MAG: thioredoxin-dependent thiol peroxidase [Sphingobacteriia bacterium]|nr:thioredoxin-dependent thiol peroxidase [Sphingobacteriia bacterium]
MLTQNSKAPEFEAIDDEGNTVSLSKFKGKKLVLYFYPKDNTPGCTTEAQDFRDLNEEIVKLNTLILGVSKDSTKSHQGFKQKYCLPFSLLTDSTGKMCEDYGVWVEKSMYGKKYMGIERTTFLIDENGIIKKIWNKVSVTNHAKEVLNTIKSL